MMASHYRKDVRQYWCTAGMNRHSTHTKWYHQMLFMRMIETQDEGEFRAIRKELQTGTRQHMRKKKKDADLVEW